MGRACAPITQQEATAALGSDPGPGTPGAGAPNGLKATGTDCTYRTSDSGELSFVVEPGTARAQYDEAKARIQDPSYQGTFLELTGVGDAACITSGPHGGHVYIFKGSVLVTIDLYTPTPLSSPADILTTLGRGAAGRV
jgi:hypothetical protein